MPVIKFDRFLEKEREEAENIVGLLMKDCRPFLTEIKSEFLKSFYPAYGGALYRGMRGSRKMMPGFTCLGERKPRKDRVPKDIPKDISDNFDEAFENKFGWKPRSQGVFAISDQYKARDYGYVYVFFPKGAYKYLWSPRVEDLYGKSFDLRHSDRDDYWDELVDIVATYKTTGLKEAMKKKYEVTFLCKSYYFLHTGGASDTADMTMKMLQDRMRGK